MATFGELKAQIKRDLVDRDSIASDVNAQLPDDTIAHYVKQAIEFFANKRLGFNTKNDTTLQTIADSRTLSLPSDFRSVITLTIKNGNSTYVMERVPLDRMIEEYGVSGTTDVPYEYALLGRQTLYFNPIPGQEYNLDLLYIYDLPALANDGDANGWTADGYYLVFQKAMNLIYANRLHDYERAAQHDVLGSQYFREYQMSMNANQGGIYNRGGGMF